MVIGIAIVLLFINIGFTASIQAVENKDTYIDPDEKGSFLIKQYLNEDWEIIQRKSFPINYEKHECIVYPKNNEVRIRVSHPEGKPFSDIEEITLEFASMKFQPNSASYVESKECILDDISYDDDNVVVIDDRSIEIAWTVALPDFIPLTLSLTANEYGDIGQPFWFKGGIYQLRSNQMTMTVDGTLDKILNEPIHTLFWKPDSGHPDGFTYVYASDDKDYLYISFDITSDNTNEIGEDWAELHIDDHVFRITDDDQQWGAFGFGYTDKVSYKHQTVEFCIPKSYLASDIISFGFRYYGTLITEDGKISDVDLGPQYIFAGQQKAVQKVEVIDEGDDGGALSIDYFTIYNNGNASDDQFAALSLWRDHGDGVFDAGSGDDTLVGSPVSDPMLSTGVIVGDADNSNVVNIANGRTYDIWVVVDLAQDADGVGSRIVTSINATLTTMSISQWKPWEENPEFAQSMTSIEHRPTGTVTVDTDPVHEQNLDFEVSVVYDEQMDMSVIPTIIFTGNTGTITDVGAGSGWINPYRFEQIYQITDVDEGNVVTVESSGGIDLDGFEEGDCVPDSFLVDTAPPLIDSITGDTTATTGEKKTIEASFSDNIAINEAFLFYKVEGGILKVKSIASGEADITIPTDTLDTWYYFVMINDTASNVIREPSAPDMYEITISDNDDPLLSDNSPGNAVAGQSYTFYASCVDNTDENPDVSVEYWFDDDAHQTKTMIPATGNYFEYQIIIPPSVETLGYVIVAEDASNNWESTSTKALTVESESGDSPELYHPVADASGPYTGYVDTALAFDGSLSIDSDGMITNYTWNFGDGSTGYGKTPTHVYNETDVFNVILIVTDNHGLTHLNTTTANITEFVDTDGDGYGDLMEASYGTNATDNQSYPVDTDNDKTPDDDSPDGNYTGDSDDDNDGWTDEQEATYGTNPVDKESSPVDTDNDGSPDSADTDDDNDGYTDSEETNAGTDPKDDASYPDDSDGKESEGFPMPLIAIVIVFIVIILASVFVLYQKGIIKF